MTNRFIGEPCHMWNVETRRIAKDYWLLVNFERFIISSLVARRSSSPQPTRIPNNIRQANTKRLALTFSFIFLTSIDRHCATGKVALAPTTQVLNKSVPWEAYS